VVAHHADACDGNAVGVAGVNAGRLHGAVLAADFRGQQHVGCGPGIWLALAADVAAASAFRIDTAVRVRGCFGILPLDRMA
jgi:hypothetical protein